MFSSDKKYLLYYLLVRHSEAEGCPVLLLRWIGVDEVEGSIKPVFDIERSAMLLFRCHLVEMERC